jgi:hypothetical protein
MPKVDSANWVVFDTEDDSEEVIKAGRSGFEKKVTQIAAMRRDGSTFYNRGNVKEFLTWLKRVKPSHVWAHNLQYDIGNLFADSLPSLEIVAIGSRILRVEWEGIEFRDTFNLWPLALAKLGDAFGLKKGKRNVQSKKYVMRDVEILHRALMFIEHMLVEYEINRFPCTLGGLAVRAWKSLGGKNWYNIWPQCREALYGGRVELFQREVRGDIYWTDINSLYPHVMTREFPATAKTVKDISGFGVADVTIRLPEAYIMGLPYRDEEGRVIFPWGKLRGIWTFAEIQDAVAHGGKILKLHNAIGCREGQKYYADYVHHFYQMRQACKDEAKRLFFKLLMNNLYGQLATRGSISRTVSNTHPNAQSGAYPVFGNKLLMDFNTAPPEHCNYLHAAYVTSYGRLELLKYLRELGERMIYCDTDSLIFTGKPPFKIGDGLGEMKLEGRGKHVVTYAPKTYAFDNDEFVAKGVPKRLAKTYIENKKVAYEQPFRLREACKFFDRGNRRKLSVWRKVTKAFETNYFRKTRYRERYFPKELVH